MSIETKIIGQNEHLFFKEGLTHNAAKAEAKEMREKGGRIRIVPNDGAWAIVIRIVRYPIVDGVGCLIMMPVKKTWGQLRKKERAEFRRWLFANHYEAHIACDGVRQWAEVWRKYQGEYNNAQTGFVPFKKRVPYEGTFLGRKV